MHRIVNSLAFKIIALIAIGEVLGVVIFSLAYSRTHASSNTQALTFAGSVLFITLSLLTALLAVRILLRARTAELVAAQAALQRSEALYREIVNRAQDIIIHVRTDTTLAYVSPSIQAVLGYTPEEYAGDPTMVARTLHPSGLPAFQAFWAAYERDGIFPETNLTLAWFARDGREVWLEHRVTNLRDAGGRVIGFQSVGRDITDRRAAEAALRDERDLLNAILATSVQGITVLNPQGQIIFANERAEAVLGLHRADLTTRSYNAPEWQTTTVDGDPFPDEAQPFQRVLRSGAPVYDVQHAISDSTGQRRFLSINGAPIKDSSGAIVSLVFSVTDITQQKQIEADLRSSEERLRALVHDIGVGVTLHDATGTVLMANPAACTILGYATEADFMDDHHRRSDWAPIAEDGQLIPPEQRPVRRARLTGQPVHNQVLGIQRRQTHEQIWLLMNASPQFAPNGELRSIVCSFSDITAQRHLEERLRQAQKLEAVGRLAGGVAHDFNNLLTVIAGACDLVLLDEALSSEVRTDVEQILQASRRAADLTRQLLAFSRRQVLELHDVSLNDSVNAAERLLRRLIGEDVQIVIRSAADLWLVRADPTQMEQVVLNLALNARDAMPEGGTLTIATANVLITPDDPRIERVVKPGPYVQLMVRDTGNGISPELQPYIFEPFFTTKESGRGTGLGLATVHGIVTQSGGTIWFTSATGAGTCFEIYLPRVEVAEAPLPEAPEVRYGPDGGQETILLVEDELPVRMLVERVLRRQGYRVLAVADGIAAQQLLAEYQGPIDLLLTDMVMPGGINGDQLALDVRAAYPQVRVMMMSGYAYTTAGAGSAVLPPDAFLQKPFEAETLTRKVRDLLDRSEPHYMPSRRAG